MMKKGNWKTTWNKLCAVILTAVMLVGSIAGNLAIHTVTAAAGENDKITLSDDQLKQYYEVVGENTVSVHDPSVIRDPKTGRYYIFGSHLAWAYSDDLETWTIFENNLNRDFAKIFAEDATWPARGSSNYDVSGYLWAPDVIYNEILGKWCMYLSVAGEKWYSTIVMLTADSLSGDWTLVDNIVYSGFTNATEAAATDFAEATGHNFGAADVEKYNRNRNGNHTYGQNAIDPCVLYDEEGQLWMSYGSWFGGIYMLRLDPATGLRDYSVHYDDVDNISDEYQGIMIAGGQHRTGEASYIQYIDGKYYLFMTYGGLVANGGYNMRVFSSDSITGPYVDNSGDDARAAYSNIDTNGSVGERLMTYYKWSWWNVGRTAQGHNSAITDEAGNAFLVYHTRTNDGTEGHFVRVHSLFTTESGRLVASPFAYRATDSTATKDANLVGEYEVILHTGTDYANLEVVNGKNVVLHEDGTISGAYTGTWEASRENDHTSIALTIGGVTYEGITLVQTMEGTNVQTLCFTAASDKDVALWGAKLPSDEVAVAGCATYLNTTDSIPTVAFDDLKLPSANAYFGCEVSWSSSNEAVIANDGTFCRPKEDTKVEMSMVITKGKVQYKRTYTVLAKAPMDGTEGRYEVAAIEGEYDLGTGMTVTVANPFHKNTGIDISNGVTIAFDLEATSFTNSALSNVWSFLGGGKLYFTGGSYLGYNAAGGYFDANLINYGFATDYIGTYNKVSVEVQLRPDGYAVFVDDKLAYSNETLAGTAAAAGTLTNYAEVLNWLNQTATEFNLGTGNWWADRFDGTISNIRFYAEAVANISTEESGNIFYSQDYKKGDKSEWSSNYIASSIAIANSSDSSLGNYIQIKADTSVTGDRGAYSIFHMDPVSGNYSISLDTALTAGNVLNRSNSALVLLSADAANYTGNAAVSNGYIVKLFNNFTENGATNWVINDSENVVTIPAGQWIHLQADVNVEEGTADLLITSKQTKAELFKGVVSLHGNGVPMGLQVIRGRGIGTVGIDNIKVYEYKYSANTVEVPAEYDYIAETELGYTQVPVAELDFAGWWAAHSQSFEITEEGVDIRFHTKSYADMVNNWEAPIYVVYTADQTFAGGAGISTTPGYKEYGVERADNYGWGDGFAGSSLTKFGTSWEDWKEAQKAGADVTVHAQLSDGRAILTIDDGVNTEQAVFTVDTAKPVYFSVSGEKCSISNLSKGEQVTKIHNVEDIECPRFWDKHSESIVITEDLTEITFHNVTYPEAADNWFTPLYVLYTAGETFAGGAGISMTQGYAEYGVVRSDNYGWGGVSISVVNDFNWDWNSWLAMHKAGTDVKVTVQLVGDQVVLTSDDGRIVEQATCVVDTTKPVYLALTGDMCTITDVHYTVSKYTKIKDGYSELAAKITVDSDNVFLGTVAPSYVDFPAGVFTITNAGSATVTGITAVLKDGSFFTLGEIADTLEAGASMMIPVYAVDNLANRAEAYSDGVIIAADDISPIAVKVSLQVTEKASAGIRNEKPVEEVLPFEERDGQLYYVVDGKVVRSAGTIEVNHKFYYVMWNGVVVRNNMSYKVEKTNGYDLVPGNHYIDENGVISTATELKEIDGKTYAYVDGILQKGTGTVAIEGKLYYAMWDGQIVKNNMSYKVEKTNGYDLVPGNHYIDENGVISTATELKEIDGKTYAFLDGVIMKGAGLVAIDGKLYYAMWNGQIVKNNNRYKVEKIHESAMDSMVVTGYYGFDADGVIVLTK